MSKSITSGRRADGRSRSRGLALVGAAALLVATVAPVVAQDESTAPAMDMAGVTIDVGGVEYAFTGLPLSVPVGTTLTFTNDGTELHEMVLMRIADDVTESLEELLAMQAEGRDPLAEGLVEMVDTGGVQLVAVPGQTADGAITLDQEGRYIALCFVPTGLDMSELEALGVDASMLGPDTDMTTLPAEAQAYLESVMGNPPHMAQGMIQEFLVTAEGTDVGPLPSTDDAEPEGEESASG